MEPFYISKISGRAFYGDYYDDLMHAKEHLEVLFSEMEYELKLKNNRNPIEYIKGRIKNPASMKEKMARVNREKNLDPGVSFRELYDGCGMRLVCTFIDDCYAVRDWIAARPDIMIINEKDYIKKPKESGYRSFHFQARVRIDVGKWINTEIQVRTIAMDCWATLEHQLRYKKHLLNAHMMAGELRRCADELASTDLNLMIIRDRIIYDPEKGQ